MVETANARAVSIKAIEKRSIEACIRSAAANPSSKSARSRSPARMAVSIGSSKRASGSSSSGLALRNGRVPCSRRMPAMTAATAPKSQGLGWSWGAVGGGNRRSAAGDRDWAELAVGLGGQERGDRRRVAGIAWSACSAYQVAKRSWLSAPAKRSGAMSGSPRRCSRPSCPPASPPVAGCGSVPPGSPPTNVPTTSSQ